jgi:hypothetical protein
MASTTPYRGAGAAVPTRAHRYWNEEVAESTALFTRVRRLVFRVPHYRSDAELQAQYEARLAAGTLPVMPGGTQVVPQR